MTPLLAAIAALTAAQARGIDAVDPNAVPNAALAVVHELGIVVQAQQGEISALAASFAELQAFVDEISHAPAIESDVHRGARPEEQPDTPASVSTATPASEPPAPVAADQAAP